MIPERLLAINVLARLQARRGHLRVQIAGSRDDYRVDIFESSICAPFRESTGRITLCHREARVARIRIDVADRRDACARLLQDLRNQTRTSYPDTDEGGPDRVPCLSRERRCARHRQATTDGVLLSSPFLSLLSATTVANWPMRIRSCRFDVQTVRDLPDSAYSVRRRALPSAPHLRPVAKPARQLARDQSARDSANLIDHRQKRLAEEDDRLRIVDRRDVGDRATQMQCDLGRRPAARPRPSAVTRESANALPERDPVRPRIPDSRADQRLRSSARTSSSMWPISPAAQCAP